MYTQKKNNAQNRFDKILKRVQATRNKKSESQFPEHYFKGCKKNIKERSNLKTQQNEFFKGVNHSKQSHQRTYSEITEYDRMHMKIDSIQNKIQEIKRNIVKAKQHQRKLRQENQLARKQNQNIGDIQSEIIDEECQTKQQTPSKLDQFVTRVPEVENITNFQFDPYSPRNNKYYVSEVVKAYKIQNSASRQHILTSLNILRILQKVKMPKRIQITDKILCLERKKQHEGKKTVVFDLDETLIHCNESLDMPHDQKIPIIFPTGQLVEAGLNVRPYARQIIKNLAQYFEVLVFTASHSCYANQVINLLDPKKQYIQHRLYRQHCYQTSQGMYIKDLRIINRNLSQLVLVDNAAYSYAFQIDNGIPILNYYHGNKDFELKSLEKYIMSLLFVKDVRQANRNMFKINQYRNYYSNPQLLVEQLYMQQE